MDWQHFPQRRTEFLIATGRLVMATFSLLAILLDPSEPSSYSSIVYTLLTAYVGYSLLLVVVVLRMRAPASYLRLTHLVDMILFTLFMFFTEGPTSPFFAYFVFSLVCATVRWGWHGTLWTAGGALFAFVGLGIYAGEIIRDPAFELDRFIIRSVYLAVVAILLGYLGAHEQKLCGDLSKLADWPRSVPAEVLAFLREMLEKAAGILDAPCLLLAWEEEEEPWLHLASWSHGEFQYTREAPTVSGGLVPESLAGTNFFCPDAGSSHPTVVHDSPVGFQSWRGPPLHPQLQARFKATAVLGLRVHGKNKEGYLFAFNKPRMTSDDLVLGEIVAHEAVTRFDHFSMLKQLQEAAAKEERIRLARDLHDGLLQSLTGAALQLERAHRLIEVDPKTAQQCLLEIQRLITAEQRDLRSSIQELKTTSTSLSGMDSNLTNRLEDLAERIKRQWGLRVEMNLNHLKSRIQGALAHEIYFIVHESLINSARHAKASAVRAEITIEDDSVRIMVADNGQGFPFRGRYDHAALMEMNLGPFTLKERIASLGGSLAIDSSGSGARMEITVPLTEMGG